VEERAVCVLEWWNVMCVGVGSGGTCCVYGTAWRVVLFVAKY
jgi:hypothetical protein